MEAAALMLLSLTYLEVDQKTAQDMEKQRNEAIREALLSDNRPWLPPVPAIISFIGKCSKAIKKQLEDSDVKDNQARLSLKKDSVIKQFLPVLKTFENVKDGIEVIAYDSYGNKYERMKFILWADKMYVFTRQWKQFCEDHKLVSNNDGVKVWMFRDKHTDKLCVVIKPIFDPCLSLAERDFRRMSLNDKTS